MTTKAIENYFMAKIIFPDDSEFFFELGRGFDKSSQRAQQHMKAF